MLHFAQPDGLVGYYDTSVSQRLDSPWYGSGSVWTTPGLSGTMLSVPWCWIERSPNVYTWTDLDREVDWCRARNLRIIFRPVGVRWNASRSWVPDDLLVTGQQLRDDNVWTPMYRDPVVFTRWKAWMEAMAQRYPHSYVFLEETNWANFDQTNPTTWNAIGKTRGEITQCLLMLAYCRQLFEIAWQGHNYHTAASDFEYDVYFLEMQGHAYAVNDLMPPGGPGVYQSPPLRKGWLPYRGGPTLSVVETASWNFQYTSDNAVLFRDYARQLKLDYLVWSCIGGAAGPCWAATKPMIGT